MAQPQSGARDDPGSGRKDRPPRGPHKVWSLPPQGHHEPSHCCSPCPCRGQSLIGSFRTESPKLWPKPGQLMPKSYTGFNRGRPDLVEYRPHLAFMPLPNSGGGARQIRLGTGQIQAMTIILVRFWLGSAKRQTILPRNRHNNETRFQMSAQNAGLDRIRFAEFGGPSRPEFGRISSGLPQIRLDLARRVATSVVQAITSFPICSSRGSHSSVASAAQEAILCDDRGVACYLPLNTDLDDSRASQSSEARFGGRVKAAAFDR